MSADDIVGLRVKVTVGDDTVEGTVFTYDENLGILTLMINPRAPQPTFKVINTEYLKSISVVNNPRPDQLLPTLVGSGVLLPSLETDLFKKLRKKVREAEGKRALTDGLTIDMCECFETLSRVFDAEWQLDANGQFIVVNRDILVRGNPSWVTPSVESRAGTQDLHDAISRVKKTLETRK